MINLYLNKDDNIYKSGDRNLRHYILIIICHDSHFSEYIQCYTYDYYLNMEISIRKSEEELIMKLLHNQKDK